MRVAVADAEEELVGEFLDLWVWVLERVCWSESGMCWMYHSFTKPHMTLSALHDTLGEWLASATLRDGEGFHVFLQVQIQEFEDKIEFVAVSVHDVEEADDVGIAHLFEKGDLADGCGGDAFIFGFEADLLEGDDALVGSRQVAGFVDHPVRPCMGD